MKEYIEREAVRNMLYDEDAITMRGVALLNKFPAADVVERVRGEWIRYPHGSGIYCSRCHKKRRYKDTDDSFCPRCGADMRKENEDAID